MKLSVTYALNTCHLSQNLFNTECIYINTIPNAVKFNGHSNVEACHMMVSSRPPSAILNLLDWIRTAPSGSGRIFARTVDFQQLALLCNRSGLVKAFNPLLHRVTNCNMGFQLILQNNSCSRARVKQKKM